MGPGEPQVAVGHRHVSDQGCCEKLRPAASPKPGSPLCLWWQSLGRWTAEAEEPRSLSPLVGPSGSRLVSRRKGKGPELGEAWQEGGNSVVRELLTQHSCALRAAIPLAAPQPWPTWSRQRSCSYSFCWSQQVRGFAEGQCSELGPQVGVEGMCG